MDHSTLRKLVIAGGSGFLGTALARHFCNTADIVILSRASAPAKGNIRTVEWDARSPGEWVNEIEGCYALINLTGKNVNCRYTPENKKEILESRLRSTEVLGRVVRTLKIPPKVWIQASTATIYRHSEDKAMDENFGETGDDFSMNVAKEWERIFSEIDLPGIRKVIIRTSIVLGRGGGALPPLKNLVKFGLGGRQGNGKQMVSWIHEDDIVNVIDWILNSDARGIYNVTAPGLITNSELMKKLRNAYGMPIGLPTPTWLLTFGAKLIGTETELVLKSRWVVPKRLLQEGYKFRFSTIDGALKDLIK
jgi:uncharacterized protein (TIGR01777 family)